MRAPRLLLTVAAAMSAAASPAGAQAGRELAAPRPLDSLLTRFPAERRGSGREWRALLRLENDPRGDWFPALGYAWLRLGRQRVLLGRVVSGAGSGYRQVSWILLAADDTLARHPLWRVRASERWLSGGIPELHRSFHARGCLALLGSDTLVYVHTASAGAPREVLSDAMSPPAGSYRLARGRMRRVGPAPAAAARRCRLADDPD